MKCKTCGYGNEEGIALCTRCGAVLEEHAAEEEPVHFERSAPDYLTSKRKSEKPQKEQESERFERDVPDYMERKRPAGKK